MNKIKISPVISCSRRTDIPAFLMKWVIQQMQIGYVDVVNPFNRNQISRISLKPEDVKCWVWWSKNFEDWIKRYNEKEQLFKKYRGHSFQFTINSPSELENNVTISLEKRFQQLEWLINEFGLIAVNYRFDPIIVYKKLSSTTIKSNLDKFEYILENVSALGLKEMIFSFATIYDKVKTRMNARGYTPIEPSFEKKCEILNNVVNICAKNNIKMKACCQPDLYDIEGVEQAHCIDAYRIEKIVGEEIPKIRDTGQRKDCGCFKSKDIGGYSGIFRCKHNCDYCYASPAKK
jgi:DNA repair photolyase